MNTRSKQFVRILCEDVMR